MTMTPNKAQAAEPEEIEIERMDEELDVSDRMSGTSGIGTKYWRIAARNSVDSQVADHFGQFYTKNEEGEYIFSPKIRAIILESRYRAARFGENDQVACRSYGDGKGTSGQTCKNCQYNSFIENAVPRDKKCKNSIILLCIPTDDYNAEPYFVQITAGGIRAYKDFAADIQNKKNRPVFSIGTEIGTVEHVEAKNKWFIPTFRPVLDLKADINVLRSIRIAESKRFEAPATTEGSAPGNGASYQDGDMLHGDDEDPFVGMK